MPIAFFRAHSDLGLNVLNTLPKNLTSSRVLSPWLGYDKHHEEGVFDLLSPSETRRRRRRRRSLQSGLKNNPRLLICRFARLLRVVAILNDRRENLLRKGLTSFGQPNWRVLLHSP